MKNTEHTEHIQKGIFLLVYIGETYNTEIVRGSELVNNILKMIHQDWADFIYDPDYWDTDGDLGPTHLAEEVSEEGYTDRLEIFLITGLKDLPAAKGQS
jgi:hypothetical protein